MRLAITILLTLITGSGYSQDLVTVASTFLNDNKYIEAKETIDDVFENPDGNKSARAWYTKGRIYHEILKSDAPEFDIFKVDLNGFAAEVTLSYNKTKELTDPENNLFRLASNQLEILWTDGINKGYKYYQEQKFELATKLFEVARVAKPQDTTAYLYAGLSAQNAQNYQQAIDYYLAMKPLTKLSRMVYNGLIVCNQSMNASLQKRLNMIEEALFEYPDHPPYIAEGVSVLIRLNKFDEAESLLNTGLERFPNNFDLRLRRADLFDRIFKDAYTNGLPERSENYFEMASEDYEIYLNRYPQGFAANYNYAVMINEQANRVYDRINMMSAEEYVISGKSTEEVGHNWTRKALPYMEMCGKIKPDDPGTIRALKVFYERLKMTDKLAELGGKG
ncbi:tetratricopeptide repeat protein [Roseivirga sp.]|uniref:tetratricopeptide repeat protein n=1 Tax=Roseivirga sp. TaxID=1964215 RepID=UPI002B269B4C|nr:tetratricopeptide repeat protein [Roseivirga sp.]